MKSFDAKKAIPREYHRELPQIKVLHLFPYKDVMIRLKSSPAVIAAFPLDNEKVPAFYGAYLIGAGSTVPLSQNVPFCPGLRIVTADEFVSVKTATDVSESCLS